MTRYTSGPRHTGGLPRLHLSFDTVKQASSGQWLWLLPSLAPCLGPAVERFQRSKTAHTPCPRHGGKDGFRLFNNAPETGGGICNTCGSFPDGFELLCWINGWTKSHCLRAIADQLSGFVLSENPPLNTAVLTPAAEPVNEWASKCEPYWLQSIPGTQGEPLRRYMEKRGLFAALNRWPDGLRFHPRMLQTDLNEHFPCMLAMVQAPDGTPWTLHRTFITPEGEKAAGQQSKKVASKRGIGSAIRLVDIPLCPVLNVAEGIETSLAVALANPDQAVWSCLDAHGLETVIIPDSVTQLVIWADNDRPKQDALQGHGEQAARKLFQRYEHLTPTIYMPQTVGLDWLDELIREF